MAQLDEKRLLAYLAHAEAHEVCIVDAGHLMAMIKEIRETRLVCADIDDALDEFAPHHTGLGLADSVEEAMHNLRLKLTRFRAYTGLFDPGEDTTAPTRVAILTERVRVLEEDSKALAAALPPVLTLVREIMDVLGLEKAEQAALTAADKALASHKSRDAA